MRASLSLHSIQLRHVRPLDYSSTSLTALFLLLALAFVFYELGGLFCCHCWYQPLSFGSARWRLIVRHFYHASGLHILWYLAFWCARWHIFSYPAFASGRSGADNCAYSVWSCACSFFAVFRAQRIFFGPSSCFMVISPTVMSASLFSVPLEVCDCIAHGAWLLADVNQPVVGIFGVNSDVS